MMAAAGHLVLAVALAAMAVLQLNDPDPLYWVVTYGAVALLPLMHFGHRTPRRVFPLLAGMLIAGLLMTASGVRDYLLAGNYGALFGEMSAARPYVEPAREFLGLLIAAAVVLGYARTPG